MLSKYVVDEDLAQLCLQVHLPSFPCYITPPISSTRRELREPVRGSQSRHGESRESEIAAPNLLDTERVERMSFVVPISSRRRQSREGVVDPISSTRRESREGLWPRSPRHGESRKREFVEPISSREEMRRLRESREGVCGPYLPDTERIERCRLWHSIQLPLCKAIFKKDNISSNDN